MASDLKPNLKVRTSELTGAALDWAVAKAEGWSEEGLEDLADGDKYPEHDFSTNWAQGGPIIEREGIMLNEGTDSTNRIKASIESDEDEQYLVTQFGPTSLMAAMRCYVASKLGDEVEVPDGLM